MLSLLLTHSWEGQVTGLKEIPRDQRPSVMVTFWTFRIMVGIGFLFLAVMVWAAFLWWRGRLFETPRFLKALVVIQPLGFIATVLGWITAEMGRQPWIVYGVLRTSEGVSPIAAGNVIWSLIMFGTFFCIIGAAYFYYTLKTLARGPDFDSPIPSIQRRADLT